MFIWLGITGVVITVLVGVYTLIWEQPKKKYLLLGILSYGLISACSLWFATQYAAEARRRQEKMILMLIEQHRLIVQLVQKGDRPSTVAIIQQANGIREFLLKTAGDDDRVRGLKPIPVPDPVPPDVNHVELMFKAKNEALQFEDREFVDLIPIDTTLTLTGTISDINLETTVGPNVNLQISHGTAVMTPIMQFRRKHYQTVERLKKLTKGSEITIRAKLSYVHGNGTIIYFSDCEILETNN